jgi:hypothetical protein
LIILTEFRARRRLADEAKRLLDRSWWKELLARASELA